MSRKLGKENKAREKLVSKTGDDKTGNQDNVTKTEKEIAHKLE